MLEPDRYLSAALFGATLFGLELTVGNSWAVTLDIGGNYAGSVSAVMNFLGNIGGAVMAMITGFIVKSYGWDSTFYLVSVLCVIAAILFSQIDAGRKLYPDATGPVT
jgi:sugar phosphate permease